jgi:hypothetical protein
MNGPADEAIVLGRFGDSDWASVCTNWIVKLSAGDTGSDFVALLRAALETGCN